jgi:hypothetical protein
MENKKDIGKAISKKLDSLDKAPGEQVWSGISYELQKRKKRRGAFFFFWTKALGLLAAGIIASIYFYNQNVGFHLFENSKDSITIDVVKEEKTSIGPNSKTTKTNSKTGAIKGIPTENEAINPNENDANQTSNSIGKIGNNEKRALAKERFAKSKDHTASGKSSRKGNSINDPSALAKSKTSQLSKAKARKLKRLTGKPTSKKGKGKAGLHLATTKTINNTTANTDLSALQNKNAEGQTLEIKTKKPDSLVSKKEKEKPININMYPKDSVRTDSAKIFRKFYVDAFVSPTLYGYFADRSTLDKRLDSLSKKSEIKFSYGFGLTYDLTEKVSVRIGYRKIGISL